MACSSLPSIRLLKRLQGNPLAEGCLTTTTQKTGTRLWWITEIHPLRRGGFYRTPNHMTKNLHTLYREGQHSNKNLAVPEKVDYHTQKKSQRQPCSYYRTLFHPRGVTPQSAGTKVDILLIAHIKHTYNLKYMYLTELGQPAAEHP